MNKKEKLQIEWPAGLFTIADIQSRYQDVPNITIRFRINRSVKRGELIQLGKNNPKIGRPTLVFAKSTISNEELLKARNTDVILNDEIETMLSTTNVMSFNNKVTTINNDSEVEDVDVATNVEESVEV